MKINYKMYIFSFILGALIFGGIGIVSAYTLLANDVSYTSKDNAWNVDNVQTAIDDLHKRAKPKYSGTTEITPTTSEQTLSTKDTVLFDNVIINPIPNTYKNLNDTTTVDANNLLSGITAYDSNGTLITGTVSTDCVSGNFTCTTCNTTDGQKLFDFIPSQFIIFAKIGTNYWSHYYNSSYSTNYTVRFSVPNSNSGNVQFTKYFRIQDNKLYAHNFDEQVTWLYMACK